MAMLNLIQLLPSMDQQTFMDMINYNLDQILSMGGGPAGLQGIQGIQGPPGLQGIIGLTGVDGTAGSVWTVTGSDPVVTSPPASAGDFWFNTSTLEIFEYDGAVWNSNGTLTVASVFKYGVNQTLFTVPSGTSALVLSPIDDYGAGVDSPVGTFKLKVIGDDDLALVNFGLSIDPVYYTNSQGENPLNYQSYISVTLNGNLAPTNALPDYTWNLDNPSDYIIFRNNGNSFKMRGGNNDLPIFEFSGNGGLGSPATNGLTINAAAADEKLIGFSDESSPQVQKLHFGTINDTVLSAIRYLTIDNAYVATGGAYGYIGINNPTPGFALDLIAAPLGNAGSPENISELASFAADYNTILEKQSLTLKSFRNFTDSNPTSTYTSTELRLSNSYAGGVNTHFIGFHGGADNDSYTNQSWPSLRIGYGASLNNGYSLAVDKNGRMLIGDSTFIKTTNNDSKHALSMLTVQQGITGTGTMESTTATGGIHMVMNPGNGTQSVYAGLMVGATAISSYSMGPAGGIVFSGVVGQSGVDAHILTSHPSWLGSGTNPVKRLSVTNEGITKFWERIQAGGLAAVTSGATVHLAIDVINEAAKIYTSNTRPILIQNVGGISNNEGLTGFIGIGIDTYYGDVPQTKIHAMGAVTFGHRQAITDYSTEVGLNSVVIGYNHKVSGSRSHAIGGTSGNVGADYSTLIGGSATLAATAIALPASAVHDNNYKVLLGKQTCIVPYGGLTAKFKTNNIDLPNYATNKDNVLSIIVPLSGVLSNGATSQPNGLEIVHNVAPGFGFYADSTSLSVSTYDVTDASVETTFIVSHTAGQTGRVGIGVAEPLNTLHVIGTTRMFSPTITSLVFNDYIYGTPTTSTGWLTGTLLNAVTYDRIIYLNTYFGGITGGILDVRILVNGATVGRYFVSPITNSIPYNPTDWTIMLPADYPLTIEYVFYHYDSGGPSDSLAPSGNVYFGGNQQRMGL